MDGVEFAAVGRFLNCAICRDFDGVLDAHSGRCCTELFCLGNSAADDCVGHERPCAVVDGNKLRAVRNSCKSRHDGVRPRFAARDDHAHFVIRFEIPADLFQQFLLRDNDNLVDHGALIKHVNRPADDRQVFQYRQDFIRAAHARGCACGDDHGGAVGPPDFFLDRKPLTEAFTQLHIVSPVHNARTSVL